LNHQAALHEPIGLLIPVSFHGVHEGHLAVADVDLTELCSHLAANRQRIWCAPVATIAQ
jgi:hypothetical protein